MAVKPENPAQPEKTSTFLEVRSENGTPIPLSWFVSLRDLMQVIAKSQGMKGMEKVEIKICSVPFDPAWQKTMEDRLQKLESMAHYESFGKRR
jgi:hypothetical protein